MITELNISSNNLGYNANDSRDTSGVIAIADAIPDMGALSILDASNNSMFGSDMFGERYKTGITAWADVLKASTSITELDLAKNYIDAADATILAPAISDNGALSSLNLADNNIGSTLVLPEGWEEEDGVFCGPDGEENEDPPPGSSLAGIIAVANAIKDMEALLRLDLARNGLGVEGTEFLCNNLGSSIARCTLFLHTYDTHADQLLSMFHDKISTLCAGIFLDALSHGCSDACLCYFIALFLYRSLAIQYIGLGDNDIADTDDKLYEPLIHLPLKHSSLTSIDLGGACR
jgi:hypothetical protein